VVNTENEKREGTGEENCRLKEIRDFMMNTSSKLKSPVKAQLSHVTFGYATLV
jgi:hypothetical protein